MKRCDPFQDFGGNKFYVPMDNGRLLGSGTNGDPCSFKPASSHDYSGIGLGQVGGDRYRITNPFNTKPSEFSVYSPLFTPQSQPYVRPEFVPYTQPSQSLIPEPKYIPPIVNTSSQSQPPIGSSVYSKPSDKKTFSISEQQSLKKELIELLHQLYPHLYPERFEDWNNNTYGRQQLENGNWTNIEDSMPVYRQQLLQKEQNILFLVKNNTEANFNGMNIGDYGARLIAYSAAVNIIALNLTNNQIGDSGGQYLAQFLVNNYNNNLTTLSLANNNLTNNGITPFADGLSGGKITKLKYLDLKGNSKICFSGMLYFFKDIDKCKTKDTSILFDKFTVNTGDIHFLTSNNKLLNDGHIPWITGAFHYQWLASIHNLNLSHNKIGDQGAKLLADSLAKGEMPNLKKLHLEGNQITDEGVSYYLDNLKKDQLNSTYVSFTSSKSTIDKIMEFFGKGARYYVSEYEKAQQSSKEADIAVNGKDGFGHCVQVVRTAGIDFASAMTQKAIAAPPIVKKVVEKSPVQVKLIVGGGLVISSLDEVKGAFLSEDFAYCMAWFNQEIIGDNGHENSDV